MNTKKWMILPYTAIMIACFIYAGIRGSHYPGERCVLDVMCDVGYYGSRLLTPFTMLGIMLFIHEDFRIGILLRYSNIKRFLCHMIKKILLLSIVIAVVQTVMAIISSLYFTSLLCNWNQIDSYAAKMYGVILNEKASLLGVLAWFFYVIFIQTAVISSILCLFWWLTQTPVSGFVAVMILLVLESMPRYGTKLFFNVVSTLEINVLNGNFNILLMIIYPIVLLIMAYRCIAVVLCNCDYLRFN